MTNRKRPARRGKVQLIDATGFSQRMRKSLGNKRNEISDEQIVEITRIHGEFAEGEYCKIFPNEAFGYRKITVEQPLRLSFQVSEERLERLQTDKAFQKVRDREAVLAMLRGISGQFFSDRRALELALKRAAYAASLKLDAQVKKVVLGALSERDETASICVDAKCNPEADPESRDTENVPLGEDICEYMTRAVLPYVPEAWVNEAIRDPKDGQTGKVGYEININRYFYKTIPQRPLEEIEADIRNLETEIVRMLGAVAG